MALLMLFALVAGAGTALRPCVLPVLPALLSAGATGGRRRPFGIVARPGDHLHGHDRRAGDVDRRRRPGRPALRGRSRSSCCSASASSLLVPRSATRFEAPLSRLARFGPARPRRRLLVGARRRRRAGLRLRALRRADPRRGDRRSARRRGATRRPSAIAYALGSALVLLVLSLGGRTLAERVRRAGRGPALQRALGARDGRDRAWRWRRPRRALPDGARRPPARRDRQPDARRSRRSHAVASRLDDLRGPSRFAVAASRATQRRPAGARCRDSARRPTSPATSAGSTRPAGSRSRSPGLRGRVVLVDFWTYTCINCIRTLPYLTAWDARYRDDGLTIVGVHTPEFTFEKDAGNVADAIEQNGIELPGRPGQRHRDLERLGQPVLAGQVPDRRAGPGALRALRRGRLRQDRDRDPRAAAGGAATRTLGARGRRPRAPSHPTRLATPETYLGTWRAPSASTRPPLRGTHTYAPAAQARARATSRCRAPGTRTTVAATARRGRRHRRAIVGKDVYLVLSPPRAARGDVAVLLDGRPIAAIAPAPTSTTAWCASIASGCTTWSRRPPASATAHAARRVRSPGLRLHVRIVPARCSRRRLRRAARSKRRRRSALATTETLENAIARLAMTGLSRPMAASGIAATL